MSRDLYIKAKTPINSLIADMFEGRVLADGGTFEAKNCLVNSLDLALFQQASLIIKPNGRKSGKIYALKPFNGSGDLTVVRATTKTEVNSSGVIVDVPINVPSFDYTNGSCPSILVEPQRTNLVLRSEEFGNAVWTKTAGIVVTSNSEISPDGTLTADTINFGASNRIVAQPTTLATGVVATGSIYVKGISGQTIQLAVGGVDVLFTLNGNWQRLESTRTSVTSIFNLNTFGGATARIISVWGAQLEVGANATSYIPTVASAVTRNADVISKTGISDLINSEEGTFYTEIAPLTIDSTSRDIEISDGNTNRVIIQFNTTGIGAFVIVGGVVQASLSFNNLDTNLKKIALKYKENDFSLFVNGVKVAFDTSGTTFPLNTLTRLDFKKVTPSSLEYYGKVKSLCLWKTALTDTQLSQLTTP